MTDEPYFPFSAIVGHEDVKEALLANAVHPGIGGVLISGTRGTAKSTAARSLAHVLPTIEAVADCPYNCPVADPGAQCERCSERDVADRSDAVEKIRTPFVNLPIGATEDRVLGTIDLETAIQDGERAFEPGLLARANRGILYVDEINLLGDHLVDVLLDAVASGTNRVEREGISVEHPADAMLVGTMNPEEGDLRPQLLDRFGLSVAVDRGLEPEQRKEVVRRRTRFEANPEAMVAEWRAAERELADRIAAARDRFSDVGVDDGMLDRIVMLCADHQVDGLRADIVVHRTARALAALEGIVSVGDDHVTRAAELALGHRAGASADPDTQRPDSPGNGDAGREQRRNPRNKPPSDELPTLDRSSSDSDAGAGNAHGTDGDETTGDDRSDDGGDRSPSGDAVGPGEADETGGDGDVNDDGHRHEAGRDVNGAERDGRMDVDTDPDEVEAAAEEHVFPITGGIDPPRAETSPRIDLPDAGGRGGAGTATTDGRRGSYARARRPGGRTNDVALDATIRAAAPHQAVRRERGERDLAVRLRPSDLRVKERRTDARSLVVFVVDSSGSMGTYERMSAVKGAILSLLEDAYQRRDSVSLVGFREDGAATLLSPTPSVSHAARELAALPTGGRTPLAAGLRRARQLIETERRKGSALAPLLVLVTDGHTNYSETATSPVQAALDEAGHVATADVRSICFDTETGGVRTGLVRQLAERMGATYHRFEDLESRELSAAVRDVFPDDTFRRN